MENASNGLDNVDKFSTVEWRKTEILEWHENKRAGLQEQEDYFRTPLGYCDEVKTNLQQVCGR